MDLNLLGKHALVGGGSKGIGRATAHALAQMGADVTVLARNAETLKECVASLPTRSTQRHGYIAVDMLDRAALTAKVAALLCQRSVQILINNTGGPPAGDALGASEAAFELAFSQHLLSSHALTQLVVPGMRDAAYGRIVNVISTSVKEPIRALGVSNTIRAAVASWSKTLSVELGPLRITVNNVLPGYTKTERLDAIIAARSASRDPLEVERSMLASVPVGRFAEPEEIAEAIAFLCSPAAAYITGINLPVDGGRTLSL